MGIYWNTDPAELNDNSLLDQHRTCHREWTRGQYSRIEILKIHESTVREMLRRGMRHDKPLSTSQYDFQDGSRIECDEVSLSPGHPQSVEFATCPTCCRKTAMSTIGQLRCRICGQIFTVDAPRSS